MRILFSFLAALIIGLVSGRYIIKKLKEFKLGQIIRTDGPGTSEETGHTHHGRVDFYGRHYRGKLLFGGFDLTNLILIGDCCCLE